ncbi:MAG: hypothetical protein ACK41E_10070 [Deinococcales bacterium]
MATVTFLQNNKPLKLENLEAASATIAAWAESNGFSEIVLHLEAEHKLLVQIGSESPLSSWIDLGAVRRNDSETLTEQLDFARGEYRRRMAGYGKFDR